MRININIFFKYIIAFIFSILLIGCNGGGSSSSTSSSPSPTVNMDSADGGIANGATNVSLTPNLVLQFSETMNPTTINSSTVILSTDPAPAAAESNQKSAAKLAAVVPIGSITANPENTKFIFQPTNQLQANTKYYVTVKDGVKTAKGASVTGQFSFTTGSSSTPTVALISPSNGQTGVSLSPTVQLQFSEAVQNVNSANITLHEGSPNGIAAAISSITAGANNTYTFIPNASLNSLTTYYIVVDSGITSQNDVPLATASFNFTTGDFAAPTAAIISPANNQTGVSLSPTIQLQFSKAVQNVNLSNVTLHQGSPTGTQVAVGSITAGANNTYSFSPSAQLSQQTTFYVVLSSNITDVNGNSLAPTTFNFTTGPLLSVIKNAVGARELSGGWAVKVDANGNTYVTGVTTIPFTSGLRQRGDQDYFVAKYNNSGALIWARQVGTAGGSANSRGIALDGSGNIYIGGFTNVGINGNPFFGVDYNGFLVKYDNNGNLIWSRQIGAYGGFTLANSGVGVDSQGNVYISGQTSVGLNGQAQNGSQDYFLVKYDGAGNVIWSRQKGAAGGMAAAYSLAVDSSGNSYLTGQTEKGLFGQALIGQADAYIVKYDANGNKAFYQQIGVKNNTVYGLGAALDSAGNVYVSGLTGGGLFGKTQQGVTDYFIAKYSSSGTFVWGTQVGASNGATTSSSLATDVKGNVYLTGTTTVGISGQPMPGGSVISTIVAKYDANGSLLMTSLLGVNVGTTKGNSVTVDADGIAYITGSTTVGFVGQTQPNSMDFYLAKYNLLP